MNLPIYIYDPTQADSASRVRGVGRYLQLLRIAFDTKATFVTSVDTVPWESIFIQPFYSFHTWPLKLGRVSKKQIAVIHDLIPEKYSEHFPIGLKGSLIRKINKISLNFYDGFITDSQSSKSDITSLTAIKTDIVKHIYPTLPFQSFGKEYSSNFDKNTPFLLYVGDGTWNKNLVNIAKAIKIAKIPAKFVGNVFKEENRIQYIKKNDTNPWLNELHGFYGEIEGDELFELKGYVSDTELKRLYSTAQMNLLVSRDEGFGYSYLEAATFGCPSILGDRPVFHEIAQDTALFADPEDPNAIADKIKALQEKEIRETLQSRMEKNVQRFKIETFRDQFLSFIETISAVQ